MEILRARNIQEIVEDTDPQQLMTYYNKEQSDYLKTLPKYKAFN